jgi:hypothetical protein
LKKVNSSAVGSFSVMGAPDRSFRGPHKQLDIYLIVSAEAGGGQAPRNSRKFDVGGRLAPTHIEFPDSPYPTSSTGHEGVLKAG